MTLHPIIDLLKRIVVALPDYTGGGSSTTPVLTKLGEYTITEPVAYIDITATEQMKNCGLLYIKLNNLHSSEQDWLYPHVNNVGNSFGYFSDKADTWNDTLLFVNMGNLSNEVFNDSYLSYLSVNLAACYCKRLSLSSFLFDLYTKENTFDSGKIEIWGYI